MRQEVRTFIMEKWPGLKANPEASRIDFGVDHEDEKEGLVRLGITDISWPTIRTQWSQVFFNVVDFDMAYVRGRSSGRGADTQATPAYPPRRQARSDQAEEERKLETAKRRSRRTRNAAKQMLVLGKKARNTGGVAPRTRGICISRNIILAKLTVVILASRSHISCQQCEDQGRICELNRPNALICKACVKLLLPCILSPNYMGNVKKTIRVRPASSSNNNTSLSAAEPLKTRRHTGE